MQFENQKKSKFSNPEKRTLCAFFGIFFEIPKNAHNVRFSGFQGNEGQGGKCAFFGI